MLAAPCEIRTISIHTRRVTADIFFTFLREKKKILSSLVERTIAVAADDDIGVRVDGQ